MTFLNIYKRVSLPLVAESQSSCILIAIVLVIGPELKPLPSSSMVETLKEKFWMMRKRDSMEN